MILVTGASGNVGACVVRELVEAGEKVRVLTREPAAHVFPDGVEVVAGDLRRPESFPAALTGVVRVFLFPVFDAAGAFCAAAREAGVAHVVVLSSSAVTFERPGWVGEQHLRVEKAVEASGLAWTFVRPDAFMTNDLAWAPQIAAGDVVRGVCGGAALAPVDPRDIAAVAVWALVDRLVGEAFVLTGPQSLTQVERVRIIGETVGRPLRFEEVAREVFVEQAVGHGMPAPVVAELVEGLAARVGRVAEVSPAVERVTGRAALTYARWVADRAAAFGG